MLSQWPEVNSSAVRGFSQAMMLLSGCAVCGPADWSGELVELGGDLWSPEEPMEVSELSLLASRQVRCIIKQGSAVEP